MGACAKLAGMLTLPTYTDVEQAAQRLHGQAHRTPVLRSTTADALLGAQLFFKCENFQRMGAFKFRGAYNALAQFSPEQKRAGVVTFSSGNHAQAMALSARLLGIPAAILMPLDAPQAKVDATRGYLGEGGEVILYDRYTQDREAMTAQLAADRGMTPIPPYDILSVEHTDLEQHARVRLAAGNVLAIEAAVKAHGFAESLHQAGGGFFETSTPQLGIELGMGLCVAPAGHRSSAWLSDAAILAARTRSPGKCGHDLGGPTLHP